MNKQLQRITAFLTAACMSTSFLVPQAFPDIGNLSALVGVADGDWKGPHFIITHYHAVGEPTTVDSYEMEDNYFRDRGTKPYGVKPEPKDGERYVGYSVSAGGNVVGSPTDEGDVCKIYNTLGGDSDAPPAYDEAHLVKINMFYQEIPKEGEDFSGEDFEKIHSELGDITYKDVYKNEEGTTVYNTAEGLHTNKTVTNASGRTYDINLESWYASGTPADVGLILDASGSMAFAADAPTPIKLDDNIRKALHWEDKDLKNIAYCRLASNVVDEILDQTKTDNSKLSFADSTYFVYDPRQGGKGLQGDDDDKDGKVKGTITEEFVPLAYWDGETTSSDGKYYVSQDALVNYWGSVEDAKKLFDEENQLNKSGTGGLGGEGIVLSNSAGTTATGTGSVTLSDSEEYSISLFIKVNNVSKLSSNGNDILAFVDDDGDKNIIRLKNNNSIEIRSSGWFFRINNVLVNNKGFVLTYVISDSGSKVYINGADPSKKDVKIGSNKVTVDTDQFDERIRKLNGSVKVTIDGKGFTNDLNPLSRSNERATKKRTIQTVAFA